MPALSREPLWVELADLADQLAGKIETKDLKTLRACSVQMENWFEGCQQYREELEQARADAAKYRAALQGLQGVLSASAKFAGLEAFEMSSDDFARDLAPFKNIMAVYGVEPYAKKTPPRKAALKGTP